MPSSIVIADDHPLILKGLQDFLTDKGYVISASAKNGGEAYNYIRSLEPDIAILDIQMPVLTGLQVAKKCQEDQLPTKIIIITLEKSAEVYHEAKLLGVRGYVLKEFALTEIETCITQVLEGHDYFSPDLAELLTEVKMPEELKELTQTELKVLKLVGKGKTAKDIGHILFSSERTIEKHKSHIRKKLNLDSNPTSLVLYAQKIHDYLESLDSSR